jgi:hypothetical protein
MMPGGCGGLEHTKDFFIGDWLQGIESSFTWTSENDLLGVLFLDEKMVGMKFNKSIIISCKSIDR